MMLPTSCTLSGPLQDVGGLPFTPEGSGDVYEGTLNNTRVSVKRVRVYSGKKTTSFKVRSRPHYTHYLLLLTTPQALYREAVVWKHLAHPNIVPLLGIAPTPLELISEWMPGGVLTEYLKANPNVDRLHLVGASVCGLPHAHPTPSYLVSPMALGISTPAA